MDNFIRYLDNYQRKKNVNYLDMIHIFHLSNIDYQNQYQNQYQNYNSQYNYPIHNNFYSDYSQSMWNNSYMSTEPNKRLIQDYKNKYHITQTQPSFPQTCITNGLTNYDMWENKNIINDLQFSLDRAINIANKKQSTEPTVCVSGTEFEPISKPIIPKQNKVIDVVVNTISDLIKLIDENPYLVEYNYNINLEALHKIRPELVELNNMVGMSILKTSVLNQLIYYLQDLNIGSKNCDYKHTVISGPPGTGKTEIAKIIGRMYAKVGILKKNVFKKVTRNDLVAGYLGQTALKTKAVINECMGGCLFIDEAYSLASYNDSDSFSKECIDTLCESLSDHKDDIMVIVAGYENELNDTFFKVNQGLESRFIWRFKIDNYNSKEMMQIFKNKVKENEWDFENENTLSLKWFENKKNEFKNYGRDMELLFSHIKVCHSRRIYGKDSSLRKKISVDDMNKGFQIFLENKKKQNVVLSTMYL